MMILTFPDYLIQSQNLAERLSTPIQEITLHHFPDGESLVRLPTTLTEHVIVCRSLNQPNDKLIELLLCARTLRESGVKRLTLVAPYLCYMRQDIANQPGEAVSQRIIGQLLADLFDDVITVDPHLHRISSLDQAIPLTNAISVSATELIAEFILQKVSTAILIGPDSESKQWVSTIASRIDFDFGVAEKIRHGDMQVTVSLPEFTYKDKPVIIVDDMASTGRTLAKTAKLLEQAGAKQIYAVITHPLFCGDAEQYILHSGVHEIWSTDSILHPTSLIKLDRLLAETVQSIL